MEGKQLTMGSLFSGSGGFELASLLSGIRPVWASEVEPYPIRVTKLTGGSLALNVHHWDICRPAFDKGRRENIRVYEFLRRPLEENFGEEFWSALDAAARHLLSD